MFRHCYWCGLSDIPHELERAGGQDEVQIMKQQEQQNEDEELWADNTPTPELLSLFQSLSFVYKRTASLLDV